MNTKTIKFTEMTSLLKFKTCACRISQKKETMQVGDEISLTDNDMLVKGKLKAIQEEDNDEQIWIFTLQ